MFNKSERAAQKSQRACMTVIAGMTSKERHQTINQVYSYSQHIFEACNLPKCNILGNPHKNVEIGEFDTAHR